MGNGFEAFLIVDSSINVDALKARFEKELKAENDFIEKTKAKLAGKFAENAPAEVVAQFREKQAAAERRVEKLTSYLQNL